jgi:hypothetical protein
MTDLSDRLLLARKNAGYPNARSAAIALGVPYPTYAGHENGQSGFKADKGELYARRFKVDFEWLMRGKGTMTPDVERMVPIVGLAGAGPDGSVLFAEGDGNFGEVPAPVDAADTVEALEVRGSSMHGLANDGWLLFYEEKTAPSRDHFGEPCVCWLESGQVLVKIPQPTANPGLYNLESVNAPTMRDVAVSAMALVTDIKTRRSAAKFVRRNPDATVQELKVSRGS